ncbi:MAG: hypothetical protein ACTHMS_21625, partial [Jatrophihabitans sp.]|uniref:hypothetical protein n=1 Tax=Jatrophihabitans sp. TaxID=1932789 RepID=UPI003F7D6C73
MTTPYDPAERPHDPQPQAWPPPAQGWQAPPQPQPQPQPWQPAASPYGQQQPPASQPWQPYAPPAMPYGEPQAAPVPLTPPSGGRGRTRAIALTAAAVVVLGGGAATYVAVSAGDSGGAGSPQAAVRTLVTDLNNSDLVGLLDDLAPGERTAIATPVQRTLQLLQKNDVIASGANLNRVSGVSASVTGLTFAPDTITVNDSVQIVQLIGGTIRLDADAARLPFSQDFLHAVSPSGSSHGTIDIAQVVAHTGHPVRIATQRVGGHWYPSLLYTIADNAVTQAHLTTPTAADRIPADGAPSPDAAVRGFVDAALAGNVSGAIGLLSPDELAVLHDYGRLIVDRLHYRAPHVTIKDLQFTDTPYAGGVRVGLKSIDVVIPNGGELSARLDGACSVITAQGQTRRICAQDALSGLLGGAGPFGRGLTAAQRRAVQDLLSGALR